MPQTITYVTSTEEGDYEAATDAEVADLVEAFEAATAAVDAFDAANPAPEYTRRGQEGYDEYQAALEVRAEVRNPLERVQAAARKALSESRNLPLGTVVSFASSSGWNDTTRDEGVIVKITPTSYVVDKQSLYSSGGQARLDRQNAHGYRSSYGGSNGGRSLHVVRTVAQQQAYQVQQSQARAEERARREAQQSQWAAERAVYEALGAQQALLREAQAKAYRILMARHAEEYEALVTNALDLLALDAPGREETAPLPQTT